MVERRESPLPHPGDAERLHQYWVHGEGAAKIGWGAPGDFDRCVALVVEHAHFTPGQAKGYCNLAHHAATGTWPAQHAKALGKRDLAGGFMDEIRAQMSSASISDLPDSAFAYIEPDSKKDSGGKTVPRSKRHFPINDAAHVRDALARAPQSPFGDKAMPKIRAAAKKFGIQVSQNNRSFQEGPIVAAVERRFTPLPVELRTAGDAPKIGGYAAKFNTQSRNLGGFIETVQSTFFDRSKGNNWPDVMARYNHDDNQLLGTTGAGTLALRLDTVGLDYEVVPPRAACYVVELVQRGDVRSSSFAFRVPPEGDEWDLNDQGYPVRSLNAGILVDVAPVNSPAYVETTVALRALAQPGSEQVLEMRRLGIGPEAALRSLARRMEADFEEVRALAEADELRRFFARTDGPAHTKPKPRVFGPAAAAALLARKSDPWE